MIISGFMVIGHIGRIAERHHGVIADNRILRPAVRRLRLRVHIAENRDGRIRHVDDVVVFNDKIRPEAGNAVLPGCIMVGRIPGDQVVPDIAILGRIDRPEVLMAEPSRKSGSWRRCRRCRASGRCFRTRLHWSQSRTSRPPHRCFHAGAALHDDQMVIAAARSD